MNTSTDLIITNIHARTWLTRVLARKILSLILLVLACLPLAPTIQAVSPTPDGAYSGANTAEGGSGALFSLTTGTNNTALGSQALFSLTTGTQNTATGAQALKNNTADDNTADGFQALAKNTTGFDNTATGWRALSTNTTGSSNTANGRGALYSNTGGLANTATGHQALFRNTIGTSNTAIGYAALQNNTIGTSNTAIGYAALQNNTIGNDNIAIGYFAVQQLTTGNDNVYIGNFQGSSPDESQTIRIGTSQVSTYITGISGAALIGTPVVVADSNQLGVQPSSARFKDEIKPMDKASEAILALKPVTFHYRKELDPKLIRQFGLVAEEVEKVNPDLVTCDADGKPYTVRYEAVNAMLLNEFLKAHSKMEEQEATISQLKSTVAKQETAAAHQQKQIEALTAGLQKVTAQVQMSRPAAQTALNSP